MGCSTLRAAILGLTVLASTTSAISLSNFTPRIDNLPSPCSDVYTSKISGCGEDDFVSTSDSPAICSPACVQGLITIQDGVLENCADVDIDGSTLIGVFQNNLGVQALCPKNDWTPSSSTAGPAGTTHVSVETSTEADATTSSIRMVLSTSVAQPSSTSTRGLLTDPAATSTGAALPTRTAGAHPTPGPNGQLSNSGSGGGSPFDVVAEGSSSRLRISDMSAAALVATAVLFAAYA